MASECGESQSSVGYGDPFTNLTVVAIKQTNRNPAIWSNYDLCVMSSGPKKARCKKCGAFFAHEGNTTLKNHMNKSCPALKAAPGSNQTTMEVDGSLWHYDEARVQERMAQFVIQETLPFDHFDNKRMTSLIQETLQPRYCQVSRTTLRRDCINMWKLAKDEMILGFGALESGVSLTCDVWTAPHGSPDSYLCVTAHWLNPKTWLMMKRTLAFELFGYPHTGQNLYAILDYVIKTYKLEKKIFSISFDNASNNTVVVDQLKQKYKPICDGVFFHSRCVTHIINLAVQNGLNVIEPIKNDFKQMLKDVFSTSNARYHEYMKFCSDENALWLGPNWDVPTRWNSTCNMFKCALRQKSTLKVFHDRLAQCNLVTPYPESSWDTIQRVSDFLGVFEKATTLLSGVYYPTNCLILLHLYSMTSKINDFEKGGAFYENMAKPMKEELKKYFKELSPVITCATALNPTLERHGVETLIKKISHNLGLFEEDPCARFNDAFDKMFQVYLTKYDSSLAHMMHQDASLSSHGQSGELRLYYALRKASFEQSRSQASSEVERYERSYVVSQLTVEEFKNFDTLGWWKERELQFPVLATMARDLLTVQASTVALESAFSVSGRVISPRRTKLTPLALEACICLKDHLDSMERIQNISPLEGDLEKVEEEIHAEEIAMILAVPLTTQEIKEENE